MALTPSQSTVTLYWYMVSWLKYLPAHKVWWKQLADGKTVSHMPISGVSV
jgi:hypothetical protein